MHKTEPVAASTPISVESLQNDYGSESGELIALFCQGAGIELTKLKVAAVAQNRERLLHNARGLRSVCESVYVSDMGKTCAAIEQAGVNCQWSEVSALIEKLDGQFALVKMHHQK